MKQTLRSAAVWALSLLPMAAAAQTTYQNVQIKDLLTYETAPATPSQLTAHPLAMKPVKFTAIVSSYPKNSGNASFNSGTGVINRIHIFVVDTNAASTGRFFQNMQIVEGFTGTSPAAPHVGPAIEDLSVGDVVTFSGRAEYFQEGVQFNVDVVELAPASLYETPVYETRYLPLLNPVDIDLSDLITKTETGTWVYDLTKYGKYFGMYVRVKDGTVSNRLYPNTRPYFAVNKGDARIYTADISLRFRNDRSVYKPGYNWRRAATEPNGEGDFVPPVNGALVDVSGYMLVNQFNPDNHSSLPVGGTSTAFSSFKIVPWDDGIIWLNGEKFQNGVNGFEYVNDVVVKGVPPGFSNAVQTPASPRTTDRVTVSATVTADGQGVTLTSVKLFYTAGAAAEVSADMTANGNVYSFEFPSFADGTSVTYRIEATASNNLKGVYGPQTFVVTDAIVSIEQIQRTANGLEGPSPFLSPNAVTANLTATVVADSADGAIVIHQAAAPWSGVYLVNNATTRALRKGDIIKLTSFIIKESSTTVANGATFLDTPVFTKTGTNQNWQTLIPTVTTQQFRQDPSRAESYEGMVIRLDRVAISNSQADGGSDFGEFEVLSTTRPDTLTREYLNSGVRINDDHRITAVRTFTNGIAYTDRANEHVRIGAVVTITGMVYPANGNPKLTPVRGAAGIQGPNYTYPFFTALERDVAPASILVNETPSFNISFKAGITFNGAELEDLDGSPVKYFIAFTTKADSAEFSNPFLLVPANVDANGKTLKTATIRATEVDEALARLGVAPETTVRVIWTIWATDNNGDEFVQAASFAPATGYVLRSYGMDFTRSINTSNEEGRAFTFALDQNFPNPFNPVTSIRYSVPAAGRVKLTVYDMLGRVVAVPVDLTQAAGQYSVSFDAASLASGVYLYRLEQGTRVLTRKMLLVK